MRVSYYNQKGRLPEEEDAQYLIRRSIDIGSVKVNPDWTLSINNKECEG